MALLTLEEHDAQNTLAYEAYIASLNQAVPTGIQCPQCTGELVNPTPNTILDGTIPRINVQCADPDCAYTGTAVQHQ